MQVNQGQSQHVYRTQQQPQGNLGYGQQNNQMDPNQYQQQQQVPNALNALFNELMRCENTGGIKKPNSQGGFNAFSYKENAGGMFGGLSGQDTEITESMYHRQIAASASEECMRIAHRLIHRIDSIQTKAVFAAIDQFKQPFRTAKEDPVYAMFADEVNRNPQLYRWLAIYSTFFLIADLTNAGIRNEHQAILTDPAKQYELMLNDFRTVMSLQFLTWLENHPDVISLKYQLTQDGLRQLNALDEGIEIPQSKINFLNTTSGMNIPFPWIKGTLRRIGEKANVSSGTIEMGMMNGFLDQQIQLGTQMEELYRANQGHLQKPLDRFFNDITPNYQPYEHNYHWSGGSPLVDTAKPLTLEDINHENRHQFNFLNYFQPVGNTGKYVCDPDYMVHLQRVLRCTNEVPFKLNMLCWDEHVTVYTLNWDEGTFDYETIHARPFIVTDILTNPDKLLPFMHLDENGHQRITYGKKAVDQSEIVNSKGEPIPIPECTTMEVEPGIVYGNKPINVDNSNDAFKSLMNIADFYDPEKKTDAFVLPVNIQSIIQLEDNVDLDHFDIQMKYMIKGHKHAELDTKEIINGIKQGIISIGSMELKRLISGYLTSVVNRWLVECRFYNEKKGQNNGCRYLKVGDIFDDLTELLIDLKQNDPETLKAFINFHMNDFFKDAFGLFEPKEIAEAFKEKELRKVEDDIVKISKEKAYRYSVVVGRRLSIAQINNMRPIPGTEMVIIKRSTNPQLTFMVDQNKAKMKKHFGNQPVPLLVMFSKDETFKVWVVTESDYDPNVLTLRTISTRNQITLLTTNH